MDNHIEFFYIKYNLKKYFIFQVNLMVIVVKLLSYNDYTSLSKVSEYLKILLIKHMKNTFFEILIY